MGARKPTIYDVARHCGVAASTVSRTFSAPERVNPTTQELVRNAAQEIGYEPRPLARFESPGRIRTLMLLVPDISNPYYSALIKAAQARANQHNYTLTLTDSDESPRVEASNLRQVLAATSGGILATSRLSGDFVRQLARYRPLVMINREIDDVPSLVWDTARGVREAVDHLAALGHRRIAYLSGPRNSWMNGMRWRTVQEETAALGMQAVFLGPFTPDRSSGGEAATAVSAEPVTAAIAYNDLLAISVMQHLRERNLHVPRDLSLIGCDDIFSAELTVPGLTTISGPTSEIGRRAVDVVLSEPAVRGSREETTTFCSHLVLRSSTAPPMNCN
ncbi:MULTISPECIES: LacI family DNA-binding transcriptional regulator [unclassified Actinopolyspora]|uniref:LacI family DNA-binding transcriptional regulator n=1 Tax=unclassified Actinopolyspora TaxID=2639451 RepID=UPI0013F604C0|nr:MULTISPECIES: LacI family DNA-binding transcriptional regulator [unclassified Actinopolyspora]NHD19368.1 LacI family transcriptional regulator [Actinopolyspora sp. BKK2]NHE78559.1 LacI family transcriptional regulator [Actinopolyspora sp. BKK1]